MEPDFPDYIETTTLGDTERKFYRYPSYTSTGFDGSWSITVAPTYNELAADDWRKPKNFHIKTEEPNIRLEEHCMEKTDMISRKSICDEYKELSPDRIFKTISIMKSKLMVACTPVCVDHVICRMTPEVKTNLIKAYRKINMFGKKTPFVARFDEFGNRLPDIVKIDTLNGMDIRIVDPEIYGTFHMSFEAVTRDLPF